MTALPGILVTRPARRLNFGGDPPWEVYRFEQLAVNRQRPADGAEGVHARLLLGGVKFQRRRTAPRCVGAGT